MTFTLLSEYPQAKKKIINNMLLLLSKYPINKIKVTQICDMSNINRSTFYAYYLDVYDLYMNIMQEYLDFFEPYITDNPTEKSLFLLFQNILSAAKIDTSFAIILTSPKVAFDAVQHYFSLHEEKIIKKWSNNYTNVSQYKLKYLYTSMTIGCMVAIQRWIQDDFKENIDEICEYLTCFCKHAMFSLEC